MQLEWKLQLAVALSTSTHTSCRMRDTLKEDRPIAKGQIEA
jgi:hypothetical protein